MENLTPFNFLHSETILSQFRILADTIASSLPPDSPAKETIRQQVQNISKQQDRWPKYVVTKASERQTPVYSSEDITKLSQSFASYTESINQGRTALKNQLTQDITRLKRSRDETLRHTPSLDWSEPQRNNALMDLDLDLLHFCNRLSQGLVQKNQ